MYLVVEDPDHPNIPALRQMTSSGLPDSVGVKPREPSRDHMRIITKKEAEGILGGPLMVMDGFSVSLIFVLLVCWDRGGSEGLSGERRGIWGEGWEEGGGGEGRLRKEGRARQELLSFSHDLFPSLGSLPTTSARSFNHSHESIELEGISERSFEVVVPLLSVERARREEERCSRREEVVHRESPRLSFSYRASRRVSNLALMGSAFLSRAGLLA